MAASAVTLVLWAVTVTALGHDDRPDGAAGPLAESRCSSEVREAVLPVWARTGFCDPSPRVAHVMGDQGRIIAIQFGRTLHAPPSPEVNNEILWVTHTGAGGCLVIDAVRAATGEHVRREVEGAPGPSIVDLLAPGCWRLDLRWGDPADQRDTMALRYVRPTR